MRIIECESRHTGQGTHDENAPTPKLDEKETKLATDGSVCNILDIPTR